MVKFSNSKFTLLLFILGIVSGVILFKFYDMRWLYKINYRYLTSGQSRKMYTLSQVYKFHPDKNKLFVLIFGGSASHHAVSSKFLSKLLTKKLKKPVNVILLSFDDQLFLDTYELIGALPQLKNNEQVFLVNTWSFWRNNFGITENITKTFNYHFLPFPEAANKRLNLLKSELLPVPQNYASYKDFFKTHNFDQRKDFFSTWLKYFLLDKLIKIHFGRYGYLFEDYPVYDSAENFKGPSYQSLLKILHTESNKKERERNVLDLVNQYEKFSKKMTIENKERNARFNAKILAYSGVLARKKGYHYIVLELPVYSKSFTSKAIKSNIQMTRKSLDLSSIPFEHINYTHRYKGLDSNPYAWWDLVHMTKVGKKAYQEKLADLIIKVIKKQ